MKSKSPLVMLEQLIMILVFALAAALCLQAFALADSQSKTTIVRDAAIIEVQQAAEALAVGLSVLLLNVVEHGAEIRAAAAQDGKAVQNAVGCVLPGERLHLLNFRIT